MIRRIHIHFFSLTYSESGVHKDYPLLDSKEFEIRKRQQTKTNASGWIYQIPPLLNHSSVDPLQTLAGMKRPGPSTA